MANSTRLRELILTAWVSCAIGIVLGSITMDHSRPKLKDIVQELQARMPELCAAYIRPSP